MFDKYIYNFLMFVNHWSTKLTSWSWCHLYSNRKKGYGYRKNFNRIFGVKSKEDVKHDHVNKDHANNKESKHYEK